MFSLSSHYSFKIKFNCILNALRSEGRAFLVITHYQRLLDHIKPDVVHIMANGRIVKTGGPELALEVEQNGYADILAEAV